MTPERWQQANQLFHRALKLKPEARAEWLAKTCSEDPALSTEVNALLAAHEQSDGLIDTPVIQAAARMLAEEQDSLTVGQQVNSFSILSLIGAGGMGEVWLAEDTKLNRKVALKVLPAIFTHDTKRLARFHIEAKADAAMNHPNIATIYSIEEAADQHFITMEYVEGKPLSDPIYKQACDLSLFFHWFVPLADALAHAHDHGVIHRDIKPGNIMITSTGSPKLLDFGLARFTQQVSEDSLPEVTPVPGISGMMGTPAYMSPEQAKGEQVGSATDLFSLGVICYEFLTGQHPFATDAEIDLKHAVITQTPLAPSLHKPEIPAALDVLIMQMLEKDARQRPNAAEVTRRLSQLATRHKQWGIARTAQAISKRHLVGREKEQVMLHQSFASAAAGQGLTLCISGEPGIGKTTLVDEFLTELTTEGQLCHIARGHSSERLAGTEAYLPFRGALDSLLHSENGEIIARLMKTLAPSWYAQIAPYATEEANPAATSPPSQERLWQEMTAWLKEVSRLRPVVMFFDDLQWADASTIDLMGHLSRQFDELRLLIVTAYRLSDLLLADHPFLKIKPDLLARGVCREIPLAFLSGSEVAEYLALEFPNHQFPADLPKALYARTEGNPLFMAELARFLQDQQIIVEEAGRWILTRSLPSIESELPESVRGMIERKIRQLSEADFSLLLSASIQGYEFDSTIVAESLELEPVEVEERLADLERVYHFIQKSIETELPDQTLTVHYSFVHALYQNALHAGLRPTRRAKLSAAVAQALQHHYGERDGEIAAALAQLWEAGRDFRKAANYFVRAAQNAIQVSALTEAAALARRGLKVLARLPEGPDRDRQELDLQLTVGLAVSGGEGWVLPEAKQAFIRASELCQRTGAESHLFNVLCGIWAHHAFRAEHDNAIEVAQELLTLSRKIQHRAITATACYAMGFTLYFQGNHIQARENFEQVIKLYHPEDHELYISIANINLGAFAPYYLAGILFQLGYPDQGLRLAQEALAHSVHSPHPVVIGYAIFGAADIHLYRREWQAHQKLREKYISFTKENKLTPEHLRQCLVELSAVQGYQGEVEEAVAQTYQHLGVFLSSGLMLKSSEFRCLLADLLGRAGQPDEGLRVIDEALEFVNRAGERFWEAEIHRTKGELLLQSNDSQAAAIISQAEACFLKAIEVARSRQARSWELRAVTSLARLWQRTGRKEEARQRLAESYDWFTEGFATADLQEAGALLAALSK